jgi:beta-mannosidase
VRAEHTSEGCTVHVRAEGFCRDVCVVADAVNPRLESLTQLVTLLPGEAFGFALTNARMADPPPDPTARSEAR